MDIAIAVTEYGARRLNVYDTRRLGARRLNARRLDARKPSARRLDAQKLMLLSSAELDVAGQLTSVMQLGVTQ